MSVFDFALFWRRLCGIDDQAIALERVRRADAEREHEEHEQLNAPARTMRERAASREPTVSLGTALRSDGRIYRVRLPVSAVRGGGHWMITGSTGSGKSFFLITILMQLFGLWASGISSGGIIIFDLKGELAQLLRDVIIPSLVASWNEQLAARLLQRLAVIAPFDEQATPPFQILAREPRLPIEVQAHEVATSFGRTIGNDLGIMQQYVLRMLLILAIDLGLTLPDVVEMLRNPAFLRWATEHTSLPHIKAYFEERFARERSASVSGLLNRLDSLVMFPALRKMLNAPGMIRFDRLIENSITIVDLGGAPAGIAEVARFFGQLMFSKVARAIFTRRIGPGTPNVTVIADEFQQLLTPDMARDFERVLTLVRSQKTYFWLLFNRPHRSNRFHPYCFAFCARTPNTRSSFVRNWTTPGTLHTCCPSRARPVVSNPVLLTLAHRPLPLPPTKSAANCWNRCRQCRTGCAGFRNAKRPIPQFSRARCHSISPVHAGRQPHFRPNSGK